MKKVEWIELDFVQSSTVDKIILFKFQVFFINIYL